MANTSATDRRGPRIALLALVTLAAAGGIAQEPRELPSSRVHGAPARPQDAAAIAAFVEQYKDAWERRDAAAYAALHSPDTEWINAYARMFQGAEPLREFVANRLFPAFDPSIAAEETANMQTISVRYVADAAAVLHLVTDSRRGASRNEGEQLRRTHIHLVLGRTESGWSIVHTAIMDAR